MNVFRLSALALGITVAITACGGGGGSSSSGSSTASRGFTLPSEISAVPSDSTSSAAMMRGLSGHLSRAASALGETSDYQKNKTKKFVEERALEQFDIIEQVLNAVSQTNYADSAVINQGPYTAMVAWIEDEDGREVKTLEPWVVDSTMVLQNGQEVNKVYAWIEEPDWDNPGQTRVIKARFLIYKAATVNADGSFADYGEWDLDVQFDATGNSYFAATSRIASGLNTIKVHEKGTGEGNAEMKGILVRSGTTGYGKVSYPDWEWCWQNSTGGACTPPMKEAQYAYNANYLGLDGDTSTAGDAIYKDRDPANAVEIAHRYGLFYDETPPNGVTAGDDVQKHKTFGFPVVYQATFQNSSQTVTNHAYYGAWQGRHELWGGGQGGIDPGTTVTRDDGTTATSYVTSQKFNGTFTKRTLVAGELSDIQDIAVETWINKNYDVFWNNTNTRWEYCSDGWVDFSQNPADCVGFNGGIKPFSDFTSLLDTLIVSGSDRKWVSVGGGWDSTNNVPIEYKYLNADPSVTNFTYGGAGFYRITRTFGQQGETVTLNTPADKLSPLDGDNLWINIGGSIYIQYSGQFAGPTTTTGWVQKTLTDFDQHTWTPTFDPNGDSAFSPEVGFEYYINNNGANFIVRRTGATDAAASYDVKIELQTAANPVNISNFIPATIDYFRSPWNPDVRYQFVTNSADSNFLKLVYLTDDPNTTNVNEVGTVLDSGEWGLMAYDDNGTPTNYSDDQVLKINADGSTTAITVDQYGYPDAGTYSTQAEKDANRPTEFNWEYSDGGWGTQQFLCTPDCSSVSNYVVLSDPVQLSPVTVPNGAGVDKTLSLAFDGWMHGMPDLYWELAKNDFQMTQAISDKVINIPAGTAVTDTNGDGYYVKPLEISIFLAEVPNTTSGLPSMTEAAAVDLSTVPSYTDNGMGAKPTGTDVLYSEGNALN